MEGEKEREGDMRANLKYQSILSSLILEYRGATYISAAQSKIIKPHDNSQDNNKSKLVPKIIKANNFQQQNSNKSNDKI